MAKKKKRSKAKIRYVYAPRPKKRRVRTMAKRKYYRKARTGGGSMKPIIDGVIAGAAASFLSGKIPYGGALANLGIGYFRNNTTLKTLGALDLGAQLIGGYIGGGSSNGGVR